MKAWLNLPRANNWALRCGGSRLQAACASVLGLPYGNCGGNSTALSAAGLLGLPRSRPQLPPAMAALGSVTHTLALPPVSQKPAAPQMCWEREERGHRDMRMGQHCREQPEHHSPGAEGKGVPVTGVRAHSQHPQRPRQTSGIWPWGGSARAS